MNLPNKLTAARLILVPFFVVLMSIENVATYLIAYVVFTVASLTDYYDGKIARERQLITNFGKLMDPLADKVLMAAAFIMMMEVEVLWVPGWTIIAILAREFLITGARSLAAGEGLIIAANRWGKIKTIAQMVFIYVFLFLAIAIMASDKYVEPEALEPFRLWLEYLSVSAISIISIFTVMTGVQFVWVNKDSLNLRNQL